MFISLSEKLVGWLAPESCSICNIEGTSWCEACRQTSCPQPTLRCYKCNKLTDNHMICVGCATKSGLDELYFASYYDKILKQLINDYKFTGRRSLAEPFAQLISDNLPYFTPDTVVTYVPTIAPHIRQRGMDQAERLAVNLAKLRGLQLVRLLDRSDRHEQRGQSRSVRLKQLEHVFRVRPQPTDLAGTTVILVDDVMTTGATLEACATTLKRAGISSVVGVALAHGSYQR